MYCDCRVNQYHVLFHLQLIQLLQLYRHYLQDLVQIVFLPEGRRLLGLTDRTHLFNARVHSSRSLFSVRAFVEINSVNKV